MPLSSASLKSVFKQFSFLHNSWGINSRDLLHLNQISRWSISMQLVQAAVNTGRRSMCLSLKEAGQVKRYFCHRGWCLLGCPEDCETSKRAQSCYSHLMDSTTPHSSISPSGWLYCVCVFSNLTSFLFIFFLPALHSNLNHFSEEKGWELHLIFPVEQEKHPENIGCLWQLFCFHI